MEESMEDKIMGLKVLILVGIGYLTVLLMALLITSFNYEVSIGWYMLIVCGFIVLIILIIGVFVGYNKTKTELQPINK